MATLRIKATIEKTDTCRESSEGYRNLCDGKQSLLID